MDFILSLVYAFGLGIPFGFIWRAIIVGYLNSITPEDDFGKFEEDLLSFYEKDLKTNKHLKNIFEVVHGNTIGIILAFALSVLAAYFFISLIAAGITLLGSKYEGMSDGFNIGILLIAYVVVLFINSDIKSYFRAKNMSIIIKA